MDIGTYVKRTVKAAPTGQNKAIGVDLPLLLAIIALIVLGLIILFSASWDFSQRVFDNPTYMFVKQLLWLLIGAIVAFVLSRVDYHLWRKFAIWCMVGTIVMLIAVLFSTDLRHGAVRSFFAGSVQPSELAKLVIVIYLSVWLYSKRELLHDIQLGLIPLAIILGIVGGLIYLQPDLSATITVFFLGGLLFFLAGGDLRQIVLFLVVAIIAGWIVVQFSPHGKQRIGDFIDGLLNPLNANYQVIRSLEAVSGGGWFGVGIGNSSTKLIGLPFPPTDSIFAVLVEELGLVGGLFLISLYGVLLWRGLKIASKAPDMLGMLLAAGLTFWIIFEGVLNMGMMVGLLPFAGNALPFISAGGSNLISSLAAVGVLMNINRQSGQSTSIEEWRSYGALADLRRRDGRRGQPRPGHPAGRKR